MLIVSWKCLGDQAYNSIMNIDYAKLEDIALIECCQTGDRKAFEFLVKKYQKVVISMLYQLAPDWDDTLDLAQEVFIRVYKHIANLRNPRTFRAWLNQITVNLFYDELRKRPKNGSIVSLDKGIAGDDDDMTRDIPDLNSNIDNIILNKELAEFIRKAMEELPEQFRTVIVLRELQGLSYEEIAEAVNCELGTVKSRISRARARLQTVLQQYVSRLPKSDRPKTLSL